MVLSPSKRSFSWYFSLIPINMAVGSIKILITLFALAIGANLIEVGIVVAANSIVTIAMSIVWGRLSDTYGLRKRFLLIFFLASAPLCFILGLADSVLSLIALYSLLGVFTSGIQPIAVMLAVEQFEGKNWQGEVVKYNAYINTGVILGLIVNSIIALIVPLTWILYSLSVFCFISALLLWKTAKEPALPLERQAFPIVHEQDEEQAASWSIMDYLDLRRIKIPTKIKKLKPIHLLFLVGLLHWIGIYSYGVGETPLMSALGLSTSFILAVNVAENVATVASFSGLVPKVNFDNPWIVGSMIATRSAILVGWAVLALFIGRAFLGVYFLPFIFNIVLLVCYALLWYPITCFAVTQSQPNRKGTTQGQLLSMVSLANVVGSLVGGFLIATLGYTVGFIVAAAISLMSLPILHYINIEVK